MKSGTRNLASKILALLVEIQTVYKTRFLLKIHLEIPTQLLNVIESHRRRTTSSSPQK